MRLIFFRKIIFGVLAGVIVSALLLLLFSLVLSGQEDPSKLMTAFSLVSLAAGAIVCGKVATAGLDRKALQGLAAGAVLALVILLPSVLISDFDSLSLLKMLATVILALAGAMLGKKNAGTQYSSRRRKSVIKRYAR